MANPQMVMYEEEFNQIQTIVVRLAKEANARVVFVIDKNGQEIAKAGETDQLDTTSLASLTAGNIAATGVNLFTARGIYAAQASVLKLNGMETLDLTGVEAVFFALEGQMVMSGQNGAYTLHSGDAALANSGETTMQCAGNGALLFIGILQRL